MDRIRAQSHIGVSLIIWCKDVKKSKSKISCTEDLMSPDEANSAFYSHSILLLLFLWLERIYSESLDVDLLLFFCLGHVLLSGKTTLFWAF